MFLGVAAKGKNRTLIFRKTSSDKAKKEPNNPKSPRVRKPAHPKALRKLKTI